MAATAQTKATAEAILKEMTAKLSEIIWNRRIMLQRLGRKRGNLAGKHLVFPIHASPNYGTGPRAESGTLPPAGSQGYEQGKLKPSAYYGRFKVSGWALDAATDKASMVNLLGREMKGAINDVRNDLARDMYGNGSGRLAAVTNTANSTTVTVDTVKYLRVGQPVVFATESTGAVIAANSEQTILTINKANNTFTVGAAADVTAGTHSVFPQGVTGGVADAANNAIAGFLQAFSTTLDYAGITRSSDRFYDPKTIDASATGLTLEALSEGLFEVEREGGTPSIILVSPANYDRVGFALAPDRRFGGMQMKLEGGWTALDFHGVPVVRDYNCPDGYVYVLDESTLGIEYLVEASWMDRDGAILKWVDNEDAYEAVVYTRPQLMAYNVPLNCVIDVAA